MKRILACIIAFGLVFAGFSAPVAGNVLVQPTKLGAIDFDTLMYNAHDIDILLEGSGMCPCPKYETYIHWYTNMCSMALGKETRIVPHRDDQNPQGPEDQYSIVIGASATSEGYGNTVVGHRASADDNRASAYGLGARASGLSSVAVGDWAKAETNTWGSVAIGNDSWAKNSGIYSGFTKPIAIGLKSLVYDGTAVGHHTYVSNGIYSAAFGGGARVEAKDAIQIGRGVNRDPLTVKIGDAYFVDIQKIAAQHLPEMRTAGGYAALQSAIVSFMEDIASNRYRLPIPENSEYNNEQPTVSSLAVQMKDVPETTDENIGVSQILNVIFGLIVAVLGFFGIKKKVSSPSDPEPTDEKKEQVEPNPVPEASVKQVKKTTKKTSTKKNATKKSTKTANTAKSVKRTKNTSGRPVKKSK